MRHSTPSETDAFLGRLPRCRFQLSLRTLLIVVTAAFATC
jgi:hypothetical protein